MADEVETGEGQEPDPKDARIGELSKQSASYRVQRNEAVRRAHAFEVMLTAHGVDTSNVTSEALRGLPVKDGRVDGQFEYTPPKLNPAPKTDAPPRVEKGAALTLDEVRQWPADQINKRWDEVQALMAQGG